MNILLVEDDDSTRKGVAAFLKSEGHHVSEASTGARALPMCQRETFDLIISDVRMPEMGGLELLSKLREFAITIPVIMITAYATVEDAVTAVQNGADDYLTKPLNLDELALKIERLEQRQLLLRENRQLKDRLGRLEFPEMIGAGKAMQEIQSWIHRLENDPDVSVMIYGESGTGKELVARTVHQRSQRVEKPFVDINCAAFSDELLESELFGYKKGAFTGAYRDKEGIIQSAHGGTMFLDEVGEMSPRMQSKLLRVIQEHTIQPVGSTSSCRVDVRILGASNKNLHNLVEEGTFREDLYYRLNVVEIHIPPLWERRDDIPLLIQHFLQKFLRKRKKPLRFTQAAYDLLRQYPWPGNVRELENLVRMLVVTCESEDVDGDNLPEKIRTKKETTPKAWRTILRQNDYKTALHNMMANFETEFLRHHLQKNHGNISKTAQSIGLSRVAVHKKLKQYGIVYETPEQP